LFIFNLKMSQGSQKYSVQKLNDYVNWVHLLVTVNNWLKNILKKTLLPLKLQFTLIAMYIISILSNYYISA